MVQDDIKKMKIGKAAGPSSIVDEMLKAAREKCVRVVNAIIKEECIPRDWDTSYIVNLCKCIGDQCAGEGKLQRT